MTGLSGANRPAKAGNWANRNFPVRGNLISFAKYAAC